MTVCLAFPAVAAPDARVLILGSLPGVESLRRREYYARKENVFWRIMGELVGASPDLPYETRLRRLVENRMALWDVCASARRNGSLDANIRPESVVPNDFAGFFAEHRDVQLIGFNGQPAAKLFERRVLPGLPPAAAAIRREILPSTSPAHARLRFEQKLALWKTALCENLIP